MGRCMAIRWGTYGDMMYALPVLERLKADYGYLHLETTSRGYELLKHHPAFDRISYASLELFPPAEWDKMADARWKLFKDEIDWDRAINFWRCLEFSCIPEEHQEAWHWEREKRRIMFGDKNFYDEHWKRAYTGIEDIDRSYCGTMWFSEDTAEWMRYFKYKYRDRFIVAMPLAGSTGQKCPHDVLNVIGHRLEALYPEILIVQMGGREEVPFQFALEGKGKVVWAANTYPYLQSLSICKIADFVVGPETSLLVGAGLFGTPKSMLCTASGYEQATAYHKNDFSIQSLAPCSPCHRAIYHSKICNILDSSYGPTQACNTHFDITRVLEGAKYAYDMRRLRQTVEVLDGRAFSTLPDMRSLAVPEPIVGEDIQPGVPERVHTSGEHHNWPTDKSGALVPCSEVYFTKGART
jgi:ADP-heptose:LPS heptosyltransferase